MKSSLPIYFYSNRSNPFIPSYNVSKAEIIVLESVVGKFWALNGLSKSANASRVNLNRQAGGGGKRNYGGDLLYKMTAT